MIWGCLAIDFVLGFGSFQIFSFQHLSFVQSFQFDLLISTVLNLFFKLIFEHFQLVLKRGYFLCAGQFVILSWFEFLLVLTIGKLQLMFIFLSGLKLSLQPGYFTLFLSDSATHVGHSWFGQAVNIFFAFFEGFKFLRLDLEFIGQLCDFLSFKVEVLWKLKHFQFLFLVLLGKLVQRRVQLFLYSGILNGNLLIIFQFFPELLIFFIFVKKIFLFYFTQSLNKFKLVFQII